MGKMSYIHYLCEKEDRNGLIEEVGTDMADGFLEAHKTIRKNKENKAYKKLNEIVDKSLKAYKKAFVGKDCVICGEKITPDPISGWEHGCNAQPVEEGECCHKCDKEVVLPARLTEYYSRLTTKVTE